MKVYRIHTTNLILEVIAEDEMEASRWVHVRTLEAPLSVDVIPNNHYIECHESGAKMYARQWMYIAKTMGRTLHIINQRERAK